MVDYSELVKSLRSDYQLAEAIVNGAQGVGNAAYLIARHRIASETELAARLKDPAMVHVNMLSGGIAKPPATSIWHIYGKELLDAMPQEYRVAAQEAAIRAAIEACAKVAEESWDIGRPSVEYSDAIRALSVEQIMKEMGE